MANAAVELIVAAAENDVIGRANRMPWHLPGDMRHFRALTLGRHVLMGRKTYESIGKALPERTNWVLSRSADFAAPDARVVGALSLARTEAGGESPLMVIGGAEIYRLCLPLARRIHLTLVHAHLEDGDTFFAEWRSAAWRESSRERHEADAKHAYAYSFISLERMPPGASHDR